MPCLSAQVPAERGGSGVCGERRGRAGAAAAIRNDDAVRAGLRYAVHNGVPVPFS